MILTQEMDLANLDFIITDISAKRNPTLHFMVPKNLMLTLKMPTFTILLPAGVGRFLLLVHPLQKLLLRGSIHHSRSVPRSEPRIPFSW